MYLIGMQKQFQLTAISNPTTFALVGYSTRAGAFSRMALKDLRRRGHTVYALNPHASEIDGEPCYPDFQSLPTKVEWALFICPAEVVHKTYPQALKQGVRKLWLQQGIHDQNLFAELENIPDLQFIHDRCILMHAEPVTGIHRIHRWVDRLRG